MLFFKNIYDLGNMSTLNALCMYVNYGLIINILHKAYIFVHANVD